MIENNNSESLEFNKIKDIISTYAVSKSAKEMIQNLEPITSIDKIRLLKMETTEGRKLLDNYNNLPELDEIDSVNKVISKLEIEMVLQIDDFKVVQAFINMCNSFKNFIIVKRNTAPLICNYASSIYDLTEVSNEIKSSIKNDQIDDNASEDLYKIRKKISKLRESIKATIDNILKSPKYQKCLQGGLSIKNGRYVVAVKRGMRKDIPGDIMEISGSGATVFIEPHIVKRPQEELRVLLYDEEKEEERILDYLTSIIKTALRKIKINYQVVVNYDFILAKGRYSQFINGSPVKVINRSRIKIIEGTHPLLGKNAVPLNIEIGDKYKSLIITGPNTGGKTVAIKTVGLFSMMVQCGLHIPASSDSEFGIFNNVLVDIGDKQSIEESLSTFSSHIKNIIEIVNTADSKTLVVLDELGAGTDPDEGMGIAIAVLEELFFKRATVLATTHHSEIKKFAKETLGFENGSMEFDCATLQPLYKLVIGKAGSSNALNVAMNLGMKEKIIKRAREIISDKDDAYLSSDRKRSDKK